MSTVQNIGHKVGWNSHRSKKNAAFYTIGYSHCSMADFLVTLQDAGVSTLIDIRYDALSLHRPEFSKNNLKRQLSENGMAYIHRRDLGIPREIRAHPDRDYIWRWYDHHIHSAISGDLEVMFGEVNSPVALMCVEADPRDCHRHRLALALEQLGLRSYDLQK